MDIVYKNPADLVPYAQNTKKHDETQVANVAESIRKYGFVQPVVIDREGVIVIGHCRTAAAKKLKLKEIPCVCLDDLTPEQIKALRIVDNKTNESTWDMDFLNDELEGLDLDGFDFDFDTGFLSEESEEPQPVAEAEENDLPVTSSIPVPDVPEEIKNKPWTTQDKRVNLEKIATTLRTKHGFLYTNFFVTGDEGGRSLEDIKGDHSLVPFFASVLCEYLQQFLGVNLFLGGWCLCTTPRRRHSDGFHFATSVCQAAAEQLGIPFYEDVFVSHNRDRLHPDFSMEHLPEEPNIILYDDIMTTGMTMKTVRTALLDSGKNVLPVVSIRNQ